MSTRRALLFSFIDRYSGLVIAVASSMVIARLLPPADIGVFSVAMALLMLANSIRDMGAGQYLVQTKELTLEKIKAVWTIQMGLGALLSLVVAILAIPAAAFYREPRVGTILWIMSVAYLINPVGSVTYARLMRDMRFKDVAVMRFVANLVGAGVSIGLALAGHGAVSLAWGSLASTVANALTAQFFRAADTPRGFSLKGVREVFSFGGRVAGTSLVSGLLNATPDFALARLQDMHAAGLYSRSNGLVSMFTRLVIDAVYNVATSMFAAQRRAGGSLAPALLRAISYVSVLNWLFTINLILLAHPVTRALYGSQWDESVELTRWLGLAGALAAPVPICTAVMMAIGRADRLLRNTSVAAVGTAVAALIGASVNLRVLGMSLCVSALVGSLIWVHSVVQLTDCKLSDLLLSLSRSLLVALACAPLPIAIVFVVGLEPASPWPPLLSALVGGVLLMIAMLKLLRHPLINEFERLRKRSA